MSTPYPNPRALTLPLRDLMRGLRQHGGPAASLAAQAMDALPDPLRDAFANITPFDPRDAVLSGPPNTSSVVEAAAALRGAEISATKMAACAAFACSVLLAEAKEQDLLISETIFALCWHDAETQPYRAAALLHALVRREPFGVAPGLPAPGQSLEKGLLMRTCIGLVLWLSTEPGDSKTPEEELVRISGWLGAALLESCQNAWHDKAALNAILLDTSERI